MSVASQTSPVVRALEGAEPLRAAEPAILEAQGVARSFRGRTVVGPLDLVLFPGERLVLRYSKHGLPTLAEPLMQPYEGSSHRALALARDAGVRTMLMGGGDNLLTGEPRYLSHRFCGPLGPLRRELVCAPAREWPALR